MEWTDFLLQALNGLATASSLFLVSAGLSIIFGVSRIVNFAHGSFYMLGAYGAYALVARLGSGAAGYYGAIVLAALAVGGVGVLVEMGVLRRIYRAPELFQLLATFGLVLIAGDAVLMLFGPAELLGARAPGLKGAVHILGRPFPAVELALIALGPLVLAALWWLFQRTRWGTLIRAATLDREMVGALGVNQARLFTTVFFLGSVLAGLGGAAQLPREAIHHSMDMQVITEAFVVVVVGGLGSLTGAFLAALLIGELHAFGILLFPKITLVLIFLVMAVVLVVRPWGLLGRPETMTRVPGAAAEAPLVLRGRVWRAAWIAVGALLLLTPWIGAPYAVAVLTEIAILTLFSASLHFIMGAGGMASFGHAAYFGLGSYGAALAVKYLALPMVPALAAAVLAAGLGAAVFGWGIARRSGIYLAMLTLAFAQIVYAAAFQAYEVTGGDNGLLGIWPDAWARDRTVFYLLCLGLCGAAIAALRHAHGTPFGYALRGVRDSPLRAEALGIDGRRQQWLGFLLAGVGAGLAGGLYAFFKGSVFPDNAGIGISLEGLVMVLLGGIHALSGPLVGTAVYQTLHLTVALFTERWHLILGCILVGLAVAFPEGLTGALRRFVRPLSPVESALGTDLVTPGDKLSAATPGGGSGSGTRLGMDSAVCASRLDSFWASRKRSAGSVGSAAAAPPPPPQGGPVLEVRGLSKRFGGVQAVHGVGFELHAGELLAMIGPNGAGKTTCFNMLMGQLSPDAGSVRFEGRELVGMEPWRVWRLGVGRTFQITATFASMTVLENVQLALASHRRRLNALVPRLAALYAEPARDLLSRVGMADQAQRACGVLAYGDLKRVELAMALANEPRLLLMDEPTAGMAPGERAALMALTRAIVQERGTSVLFTEHDMDVVFTHADRILVLNRGERIAFGTPEAVRGDPRVQEVYLGSGAVPGGRAGEGGGAS